MSQYAFIAAAAGVAIALGGLFIWYAFRSARKLGESEGFGKGAAHVESRAGEANAIEDSVGDLDPGERERLLKRRD